MDVPHRYHKTKVLTCPLNILWSGIWVYPLSVGFFEVGLVGAMGVVSELERRSIHMVLLLHLGVIIVKGREGHIKRISLTFKTHQIQFFLLFNHLYFTQLITI